MTDGETLPTLPERMRAAAHVLIEVSERRYPDSLGPAGIAMSARALCRFADDFSREDAAKSNSAARDRHLADVAYVTWRNLTRGVPGERDQIDVWIETIRAVREAIEAEQ